MNLLVRTDVGTISMLVEAKGDQILLKHPNMWGALDRDSRNVTAINVAYSVRMPIAMTCLEQAMGTEFRLIIRSAEELILAESQLCGDTLRIYNKLRLLTKAQLNGEMLENLLNEFRDTLESCLEVLRFAGLVYWDHNEDLLTLTLYKYL